MSVKAMQTAIATTMREHDRHVVATYDENDFDAAPVIVDDHGNAFRIVVELIATGVDTTKKDQR